MVIPALINTVAIIGQKNMSLTVILLFMMVLTLTLFLFCCVAGPESAL